MEHIAIGNGTASRETEQMTVELIHKVGGGLSYMIVSEAGASVYFRKQARRGGISAVRRQPRSAVSIARRLQDPLAELVKIDPKAIGVGQYQHDMPQKELDASLNAVVEDCVNAVGVDLNTASPRCSHAWQGSTGPSPRTSSPSARRTACSPRAVSF